MLLEEVLGTCYNNFERKPSVELKMKENKKYPKPPVVKRAKWECPDGDITTHGDLSYTTVTHLIVHHTAMGVEAQCSDWAALTRRIWEFHVFERGWADIGYNYLIDPLGVIYEGRSGGDNVIGAHFSGVNPGTMAVALMGDFNEQTPSADALKSLREILAWKCEKLDLDPQGKSLHESSQLILNVISGHRDGPKPTECPGENLYTLLPLIRAEVKNLLSNR